MEDVGVSRRLDSPLRLLTHGDVHVWNARTHDLLQTNEAFERSLDENERARAARFQRPDHRRRYVLAHGLQRYVLASYLGIESRAVRYRFGPKGKPFVDHPAGLSCSLSYSGDRFVIAVGRSQLGVDIEAWAPFAHEDVIASAFSAAEQSQLAALGPHERRAAFFDLWTRKEAYLKATGVGIGDGLQHVDVSARLADRESIATVNGWQIRSIDVGRDISGALAATAVRTIAYFRAHDGPG
jgi:4'-phosphopantetheinyl transferase